MTQDQKPRRVMQIDMNADGTFRSPEPQFQAASPLGSGLLRVAILVTALAAAGAIAFVALWLAMTLIPIAIGAGLIAYGVLRYRMWKAGISFRQPGFGRR